MLYRLDADFGAVLIVVETMHADTCKKILILIIGGRRISNHGSTWIFERVIS